MLLLKIFFFIQGQYQSWSPSSLLQIWRRLSMFLCPLDWTIVMCCFWVWIRILSLVCSLFRTQLLDFQQVQGERAYYSCWSNRIGYLYDTEFTTKCCCMFSRLCMVYHLTVTDWISVCQSSRYLCSNDRLLLMVTRSRLKWINVEVLVLSRFPCFV